MSNKVIRIWFIILGFLVGWALADGYRANQKADANAKEIKNNKAHIFPIIKK